MITFQKGSSMKTMDELITEVSRLNRISDFEGLRKLMVEVSTAYLFNQDLYVGLVTHDTDKR